MAEEIEHRQWQTAAHTVVGGIYTCLLAYPQAREHFEQALTLAHEIGSLFWTSIATGHLASALISQGDHEEAEKAYSSARTLIEELAVTMPDESLRDDFLHKAIALLPHARPLSPAKARKQAFGGLSTREREVAVLVAQGKSNREIADMLVLSERTIESHVSSILFKLDYTSRTQIATWVIEKGLTEETA
jgi:DNA-binding NarL/FixJ family response regulator